MLLNRGKERCFSGQLHEFFIWRLRRGLYSRVVSWDKNLYSKISLLTGVHNQEPATPILSLFHGVFTDQVIFRQANNYYFPLKFKFWSAWVLISPKIVAIDRHFLLLRIPNSVTQSITQGWRIICEAYEWLARLLRECEFVGISV